MAANLRFYKDSIVNFCSWALDPQLHRAFSRINIRNLDLSIKVFRLENLEDPKIFNYFYLLRFFFGNKATVRSLKKYFILGLHYQNLEIGFSVRNLHIFCPMTVWIFNVQPLVNLGLTRDYLVDSVGFHWLLRDLSVFSEKKTNAGLFFLEDPLAVKITFRGGEDRAPIPLAFYKQFLRSLKILL